MLDVGRAVGFFSVGVTLAACGITERAIQERDPGRDGGRASGAHASGGRAVAGTGPTAGSYATGGVTGGMPSGGMPSGGMLPIAGSGGDDPEHPPDGCVYTYSAEVCGEPMQEPALIAKTPF